MTTATLVTSFKKITHTLRYGSRLNPARDWLIALGCFLVLFVASIIWNTTHFLGVVAPDMQTANENNNAENAESTVMQVEKVFQERARALERLQEKVFVDPS